MPLPRRPNNVIAPYWDDLTVGDVYNTGAIYTLSGGITPYRYFVVEWRNVTNCCSSGATDYKTFQVILLEGGGIKFQYQTLNGYLQSCSVGIEDAYGLDGLQVLRQQPGLTNGKAFLFTYPGAMARVYASPLVQGAFAAPGAAAKFTQLVRNNGDLGADTYDLTYTSTWPISFYGPTGNTLTDTDSDGKIDTGSVAQGSTFTVGVQIDTPSGAATGDNNIATVTAQSSRNPAQQKQLAFQAGVPAQFAQSHARSYYPHVSVYRPSGQTTRLTASASGNYPVVATTPDGKFVQVWSQYRTNSKSKTVSELYYAVVDDKGNLTRAATRITDNDLASISIYDGSPAVAVAPNGNVGIVWQRQNYSSSSSNNYNIYYQILNSTGDTVKGPTDLTENSAWGGSSTPNVPRFYAPNIAATANNRFVLAWYKRLYDGSAYYTLWYAVQDASGTLIKPLTQFGSNTYSFNPSLTPLSDGTVFVTWYADTQIYYGRLNSSGDIVTNPAQLQTAQGFRPDAVQLPNGNIVLAWTNDTGSRVNIQYAVLNSSLGTVKSPRTIPSASPVGDDYVSVTYAGNQAVLTWGDTCCDYQPNLYYALIDASGNRNKPPIIFASDYTNYYIGLPMNGQGNTFLIGSNDVTSPTNPITLTSTSHDTEKWSKLSTITVTWAGAKDDSGIDGYSIAWDNAAATVPDTTKDLEETITHTAKTAATDGSWYFHIRAVDNAGNWATGAAHLGPFKIDTTPPQSSAQSPEFVIGTFHVTWSGTDASSGIQGYNVWVRPGSTGTWTRLLSGTVATGADFKGAAGYTYYFRSEAIDKAGNVETDLPADGDTHTTIAAAKVEGQVTSNRHQPVFNATITAQPSALNVAKTDAAGNYILYIGVTQTHTLTASRAGFGILPPLYNLSVNANLTGIDFVLPPENDLITNGGWETGALNGWHAVAGITPTVVTTATHTGRYGLQLNAAGGTLGFWPYVTRTVSIPSGWAKPTLSWLYRAVNSGNAFQAIVSNISNTVIHTLPITPGGWTHVCHDLTVFKGQTVTLSFGFSNQSGQVYLDEISLGDSRAGMYPVYLPIVTRNA
jgi:hypothetical protein